MAGTQKEHDLPTLIDKLGAAALEVKALLSDLRSCQKTLRLDIAFAKDIIKELEETTAAVIQQEVNTKLGEYLADLEPRLQTAINDKSDKIIAEFARLTDLITKNETGQDWRDIIDGGLGRLI